MGLYDRPYWREPQQRPGGGAFGGMRVGFPKPARAVKVLLLINVGVFLVQLILATQRVDVSRWLGVTVTGFWLTS